MNESDRTDRRMEQSSDRTARHVVELLRNAPALVESPKEKLGFVPEATVVAADAA